MSKKKPKIRIESYGQYTPWERGSRELPKICEFSHTIEAVEGNEFGMILSITGGKGIRLDFRIKHPPFRNEKGNIEPDFVGEYFVNSNNYEFYIGDCIWLPVEDKVGEWTILVYHKGNEIARQVFHIVLPDNFSKE
jgi:hypothetical protein